MKGVLFVGAAACLAAGCLTVSQSEYPVVETSQARAVAPTVALSGFDATVTRFLPIYGYATVWNNSPGYYHRGHYHHGFAYPETVSTTTYVPRTEMTAAYVQKAQDVFEKAGYVLSPTNAAYIVDVKFSGPTVSDNDRMAEFATVVLTAGLSDRTTAAWSARLKVTEAKSGRVVFSQDYRQEYTAWTVGLVPLFSALSAETVQDDYIQNWCLSALTDRSAADATAYLAGVAGAK